MFLVCNVWCGFAVSRISFGIWSFEFSLFWVTFGFLGFRYLILFTPVLGLPLVFVFWGFGVLMWLFVVLLF